MNDDLERLITDSLDERGAGAASSGANLDAVFLRVGRRRTRRRAVAAVGSVALVGVGVVAIAALDGEEPLMPAATPDSASVDSAPVGAWAEFVPAGTPLWKCSGPIAYSDAEGSSYFADCESVTLTEDVGGLPSVAPTTVWYEVDDCFLDTTTTTVPSATTVPGEPTATTVQPLEYAMACELVPAPTAPPTTPPIEISTTTTSIWCEANDESVTMTVPCTTVAPVPISEVEQRYVVVAGDSLMRIAERYGISAIVIVDYNAWTDGTDHQLFPGDEILIPPMAVIPDDR